MLIPFVDKTFSDGSKQLGTVPTCCHASLNWVPEVGRKYALHAEH